MNRPDKPGELSIDEILASIRQKTSEAPEATRSASDTDPATTPGSDASPPPPPPPEAPSALLERLNGVHASAPNGSKRLLPFDQDLADMFDEPEQARAAPAAPKPEMRVSPDLGAFSAKPAAGGRDAERHAPSAAAPSSSPAVSTKAPPLAPPPPFGAGFGASDGDAASTPRPPPFGFPPLTSRAGFYPPQRSEPHLPPVSGARATPTPAAAPLKSPEADGAGAAAPPGGNASGFSDLGSLVPGDVVGRGDRSSFGAPPLAGSGISTLGAPSSADRLIPDLDAGIGAPASEASASPALSTPAPFVPSLSTRGPDPAPTPPRASSDEGLAGVSPAAASGPARPDESTVSLKPAVESAAADAGPGLKDPATQALDALAQGLAASSVKSDAPVTALRPVEEPAAGDAEGRAQQSAAPAAGAAVRTLEDAVADMLRPMLQKWVQENMPRIMEKALRVEMAKTLGSGPKPPGS